MFCWSYKIARIFKKAIELEIIELEAVELMERKLHNRG